MSDQITTTDHGIVVSGPVDGPLLDELESVIQDLRSSHTHVVIDLNLATLVDLPALVRRLVTLTNGHDTLGLCLVCHRVTGRVLLERSGASAVMAVFESVGDAMQARVMQREGYGDGWEPGPGVTDPPGR